MTKLKNIYQTYFKNDIAGIASRLVTAWLFAAELLLIYTGVPFTSLDFLVGKSFALFLLIILILFLLLCPVRNERLLYLLMTAAAFSYGLIAASEHSEVYFLLGCCLITAGTVWFSRPYKLSFSLSSKSLWMAVTALMLLFTLGIGAVCCMKYKNHWTPCYDFGIFAQMFEYMKETGLPFTTCERDGLLSHLAVHFSPIFYIMLPFYVLMPSPLTLMIGQCLIAASGVIPFVLICRSHKLSNPAALVFSACYLLYPAFAGGCGYYLHENNFLAPLILWFIYFLEKDRLIPVFAFGLLTLAVKEDAAVYTAIVSLYFIFAHKNYKCSASAFIFSILYFLLVTMYLSNYGEGVMTGRYGNYIYDGSGLLAVIKSAVMNPLYAVQQCLSEAKIKYILQMFLPLMFMPFRTKKAWRLILLLPFILVNIMTNYSYQYDIYYQYGFGSGAILLYLTLINYADMGKERSRLLLCAALSSCIIFIGTFGGRFNYYGYYQSTASERETIDTALSLIPKDASVSCCTFILPNLYYVKELYQLETTEHETDYYVVDLRIESEQYGVEDYLDDKFETVFFAENIVGVFIVNVK